MATAWVRWPDRTAKGWRPTDPEALAYLASLRRCVPRGPGLAPPPTLVIDGIDALDAAIVGDCRAAC